MSIRDKEICRVVRRSVQENVYHGTDDDSPELCHFGIKGMKWGIRRFQNKDGSYTNAGKKRYNERPKSRLEQDIETRLDKEMLTKAGYKLDMSMYGCDAYKEKNGVRISIRLEKYDNGDYRLVDDPEGTIKSAEKFMNSKAASKMITNGKDRFYDEYKDYTDEKITKEEFRSRVEPYSISLDPQYKICEVSYDDDGIHGGHSLDVIVNMDTGEIEELSMNG